MEKTDLRFESEAVRLAFRKRAISLLKGGKKKKEIAIILGVSVNTLTDWCKKYKAGSLKEKKKGVSSEDAKYLTNGQEREIQSKIIDVMPSQYKLDFALWTRKAVQELIFQEFNIKIAITTTGDYLRKWGFTPQKPKKKAYEQQPAQVQKWLDEQYPAIKELAKKEEAEIHWGDETGVRNNCQHGRSYAPKGKTPIKLSMSKRFSINMISTVTNQGKVQFMVYSDNMNSDRLIEFMKQLIKSSEKKIYLILDNLRVHHSKLIKEWIEEHKDKIALFFLPSYSPEKNPDEYLNCDLKQGMSAKPAPKNVDKLLGNVKEHMEMLQEKPERLMKYFQHQDIKYAA